MKKLFKFLLLVVLAGIVAGVVASILARKRLEAMSDDEIRAYLASKLEGRVGDEQLATIQEAAIAGVRRTSRATPSAADAAEDATTDDEAAAYGTDSATA